MLAALKRLPRFVAIALAVAFLLRLLVIALAFTPLPRLLGFSAKDEFPYYQPQSDETFYRDVAEVPSRLFILEHRGGWGVTTIGPVYPLFLAPFFALIPDSAAAVQFTAIRVSQALIDTLSALVLYLLGQRLFDERAARVALAVQALDIRYMLQAGTLMTETLYLFGLLLFFLLYVRAANQERMGLFRAAGAVLGFTVLLRPIPLLFPLALGIHAWFHPHRRAVALKGLAWLVGMMLLVLAPWQARVYIVTGDLLPVSKTGIVHLWLASREDGQQLGAETLESERSEEVGPDQQDGSGPGQVAFVQAALGNILEAPARWAGRILRDTLTAYLQPYGTVIAIYQDTGISLKQATMDLLAGRLALADYLRIPYLGRRILIYIWHYGCLLGGLVGIALLLWRREVWGHLPLLLWIIYVTAVSALLLVEPRYLFPLMFALTLYAAYAAVTLWETFRHRSVLPAQEVA